MATLHQHRLVMIVPIARVSGINAWIRAQIDPTGGDWFTANLSLTGTAPATHAWASFTITPTTALKWAQRIAAMTTNQVPPGFAGYTRNQKKAWLESVKDSIRTQAGVYIQVSDNDGAWADPYQLLSSAGLQII